MAIALLPRNAMLSNSIRRMMCALQVDSLFALGIGAMLLVGVAGCSKDVAPQANEPAETVKSSEQDSFDRIVAYMRHMLVDDDPARPGNVQRFPANNENPAIGGAEGVLTYELKLDASPEVVPPANPGEPTRGRIEVTMITSYSRIQQQAPDDGPKQEEKGGLKGSTIDKIIRDPDLQVDPLDTDQILKESGLGREATKKPAGTVVLEPRKETVVFDLEYVGGKWRLANTDLSTHLSSVVQTLEAALARQR